MTLTSVTVRLNYAQVADLLKDVIPPGYRADHPATSASCSRWTEPGDKSNTLGFDITFKLIPTSENT